MSVDYTKLLKLLDENGYNSYKIKTTRLMSCGTYQNIKNGTVKKNGKPCGLDLETLEKIAHILKVKPWDLVDFVDSEDND